MKQAILAAEDERFYQHTGVDYLGVMRAAYSNLTTGGKRQGASTITMQVARNFFLSSEKTLTRKLYEALLAFKIEASLSKDEILQIYINQIYLGQRAYGFAAAAQIYFGKALDRYQRGRGGDAGRPAQGALSFNPVVNPKRAKQRQLYVLRRMHELGHLTDDQFAEAQKAPTRGQARNQRIRGPRRIRRRNGAADAVRALPDDVYTKAFASTPPSRKADQEAAYAALRRGVLDYDKRHGYRGPEGYVDLGGGPSRRGHRRGAVGEPTATTSSPRWCWRPARAGARLPPRRGNGRP